MLEETVKELTGTQEETFETTIDLNVAAYIPDSYILDTNQNLIILVLIFQQYLM